MSSALPEDKLREIWQNLTGQVGTFKRQTAARTEKVKGYDHVFVTCEFERATLDVKVVYDKARLIAGLFFVPAKATAQPPSGAAAKAVRLQDPVKPYPYTEEEVTYENRKDAVKLAGTLTLPRSAGPHSAVLLITGSGSQDRNSTLFNHRPFLVLADHLTRQGIAVLRVDDRGVGGSSAGTDIMRATSENFAGDVIAGVEFLKTRKDVDPRRIGLIGHSEGGMIAPMVAAQSKDVAFIVLMAGTGLTGAQALHLQNDLVFKAGGASDEMAAGNRLMQQRLFDVLKSEKDERTLESKLREAATKTLSELTENQKKALGLTSAAVMEPHIKTFMSPWMRFFVNFDPRVSLQKVKCPVLAINGERDVQIAPKENLAAIAAGLKAGGNRDVTIIELPRLNHLFQTSETGALSEYEQIEETIAPVALNTISAWITKHTTTTTKR